MKKKHVVELAILFLITGIATALLNIPMRPEPQASIPEPALILLFGIGLMGIAEYLKKST